MSGATILIVDDEPDLRELVKNVLVAKGYDVVMAEDGDEALAWARDKIPDLIVMDLNMPLMDGFEATRRLKADAETKSIPVIALSAETVAPSRDAIYEAGCDAFVDKPIDFDILFDRIGEILGA